MGTQPAGCWADVPAWRAELARGTVGAVSELIVASDLLTLGYDVFRSVSPHSKCDLVAVRGDRVTLVEVKTGRTYKPTGRMSNAKPRACQQFDALAVVDEFGKIHYDPPEALW